MSETIEFRPRRLPEGRELPSLPSRRRIESRTRRWLKHAAFILAPVVAVALYLFANAADRYDVTSDFSVQPLIQPGMTNLLSRNAAHLANLAQPAGPSAYDAYMVMDYLQSGDALKELEARSGFLARYRGKTADLLYRPEPWRFLLAGIFGRAPRDIPFEDALAYYNAIVVLRYSMTENIVTLEVQAFDAEDARIIAATLLDMGESFINRVNERALADMVASAERQVTLDEARLNNDHQKIQSWRAGNSDLNPDQLVSLVTQVIQGLENSLVAARADLMQTNFAEASPARRAVELRVKALEDQIAREQQHLGALEHDFAAKYYEFDRLKEDIDFAKSAYQNDLAALQGLRALASQQGIYLMRIYEPHRPDAPLYPQWWLVLPLTLAGSAMAYAILRTIVSLGRDRWRA